MVGKIVRMLVGYAVLCALLACLGLLLLPRLRLAGGIGLAACVLLIAAWWLLFVRSHGPAARGDDDRAGVLSSAECRDADEDWHAVYWVDRLRRGPGPGGPG
jgi:hypothetical protein